MRRIESTKQEVGQSRRSFVAKGAALGAAIAGGFAAKDAIAGGANTQHGNLDLASLAQHYLCFPGSNQEFRSAFHSIQAHENAHVAFLVDALGKAARPKPTFQNLKQSNVKNFIVLARAFENTGAGAYLNAAPAINSQAYLAAAGSIALVEGRHAGFINVASGEPITLKNANFEAPITPSAVAAAVSPYIKSLNGGPELNYSSSRSASNDIAILNFALALEYLEAEFYNINVPKFY